MNAPVLQTPSGKPLIQTIEMLSDGQKAAMRRIARHDEATVPQIEATRPAAIFTSQERYDLEQANVFRKRAIPLTISALVAEPGTGLQGKLKTARKGVGDYVVTVKGKAAHAGVDFTAGASAIVEVARQVEKIASFTNLKTGVTVNPGVIRGGTRTNVIAGEAQVEVDIRIARMRDYAGLHRKFQGLKAVDKRCQVEVTGGLNRPPMERTPGCVACSGP